MKSTILPESWLRCMTPEDRKALGQMTAAEALEVFKARNERQLQSQIVQDLRRRGIEVCWHRMDKKSAATVGWPDLTFAIRGEAIAWEVKYEKGQLSDEQQAMADKLQGYPNNWTYKVIRSFQEYLREIKSYGI